MKIYVIPVEQAVRIASGDRGEAAVSRVPCPRDALEHLEGCRSGHVTRSANGNA